VKINQYCSVCKKHLDMEVIPTDDGGDDGVIWLRCPECQGFLPKFTGEAGAPAAERAGAEGGKGGEGAADEAGEGGEGAADEDAATPRAPAADTSAPKAPRAARTPPAPDADAPAPGPDRGAVADLGLPPAEADSLADGAESAAAGELPGTAATGGAPPDQEAPEAAGPEEHAEPEEPAEPVAEYAARLAETDPASARPYRPTDTYAEGELVHHLAYDDVGLVVAKETLSGGRRAVKVYFEKAGVVHLIEQAGGR
jgi:hypothetical protein